MKRRIKERRKTPVRVYDVRAELPKETLAALGSCALLFNEMQASLDTLLCLCLDIESNGWRELTTRIGGLEQKSDLCKFWLANVFEFSPSLLKQTTETFASFAECRHYRDTAVHCRIVDAEN